MATIEEVAKWKLEAKLEDNNRYFYNIWESRLLENGDKAFVIGRKGTGKTAICQYITGLKQHNIFSAKLSFKNFPFKELYALRDEAFSTPNEYITLWKYVIYSFVCKLLADNEAIDGKFRSDIRELFGDDPTHSLRKSLSTWTTSGFQLSLLGVGGGITRAKDSQSSLSWAERVIALEELLLKYVDGSTYFIVFDELDEDYKFTGSASNGETYFHLLTSLFKAVQDVRAIFQSPRYAIRPIVFLRDDIYERLVDSDKNKWKDFRLYLEWDTNLIKELLKFRLSRAANLSEPAKYFPDAWHLLFSKAGVPIGRQQKKRIPSYEYIENSTLMRPRDFVHCLKVCAEDALNANAELVAAESVRRLDKGFSNYLKDELVDEIHGTIPDITEIFNVISQLRKRVFRKSEFEEIFASELKKGAITSTDPEFVLRILFQFSVLGNQSKMESVSFFKYKNKEARVNFNESFAVHRGLYKALQIYS